MSYKEKKAEKPYKMHLQLPNKILRGIFWAILLFIFLRGILSFLKPDRTVEILEQVTVLKTVHSEELRQSSEIEKFAESFIYEWTTYEKNGREDFKNKVGKYLHKDLLKEDVYSFKTDSSNVYVNAYRIEDTGTNIYYVYVRAKVSQSITVEDKRDERETEKITEKTAEVIEKIETVITEEYIYKVPIEVVEEGKYLVRYLPKITNDDSYYSATSNIIDGIPEGFEEIKNIGAIETSIVNFLKSYYAGDESVVDYYLDVSADRSKFTTLKEEFLNFLRLENLKIYKNEEGVLYANVKYKVKNSTEEVYLQNIFLELTESVEGNRFYIKNMELGMENLRKGGL